MRAISNVARNVTDDRLRANDKPVHSGLTEFGQEDVGDIEMTVRHGLVYSPITSPQHRCPRTEQLSRILRGVFQCAAL
jgi:hypothetical protein